jgi:hypothetical protein
MNKQITVSRSGLVAQAVAALGLFAGVAATSVVLGILTAAGVGSYVIAVKIVDAVIAGAGVATVVAALIGGGVLGASALAAIRWAIGFWGRAKAIN